MCHPLVVRLLTRPLIVLLAAACVVALASSQAPARPNEARIFTGYGFDACGAPSLTALSAWLASPYRAVGIYIGGVNRACPDGNLSSSWIASAAAGGWNLLPLYVGLQAPCVAPKALARIDPAAAATQGASAAEDAAGRAAFFGLEPGDPIYFDMEGYPTNQPACTEAVQSFVSAWVSALHDLGYAAGIYGSAASTIRDMVTLATSSAAPDQVWIANWNGKESVFGDPYVPDSYWANHQRIHQYRGGHTETYGGVTINVDSNYVDGAVARVGAPAEGGGEGGGQTAAGSTQTPDGRVLASWPKGAFSEPATVTLTSSALARTENGFAAGSYILGLGVTTDAAGTPVESFRAPLVVRFAPPSSGLVPAFSPDGTTWTVLLRVPSAALPVGATAGYRVTPNGTVFVYTVVPGAFALLRDVGEPVRPEPPNGLLHRRELLLSWQPTSDNSGTVARYEVLLAGDRIATLSGTKTATLVQDFRAVGPSVFRIVAVDPAGNRSTASRALVVVRRQRPPQAPRVAPGWAWHLLDWQRQGRHGPRPRDVPAPLPTWYWPWAAWQLQPFRIA